MIDSHSDLRADARATDSCSEQSVPTFATSLSPAQLTNCSNRQSTPRVVARQIITSCAALLFILGVAITMSACSSIASPIVTVESVARSSDDAQTSYVEIVAENPNAKELPILSVKYAVTAAGQTYSAKREGQETLSRFGQRRLRLPVVMNLPAGEAVEVSGTLEYLKPSTIARTLQENGAAGSTVEFSSAAITK